MGRAGPVAGLAPWRVVLRTLLRTGHPHLLPAVPPHRLGTARV